MRGVHGRQGPPPDPQALRRDHDRSSWTRLPAVGRQAEVPDWPLSNPTVRERALWAREWARPQALMWEANGQHLEVAIYVRTLRQAESPRSPVAMRTLLRQQMEALGLTVPGLARNRWVIDEPGTEPEAERTPPAAGGSAKERALRLVG